MIRFQVKGVIVYYLLHYVQQLSLIFQAKLCHFEGKVEE